MEQSQRVVLASGSPRRRQILDMLGVQFDVVVSHADESIHPTWSPSIAVTTLAKRKAYAVKEHLTSESRIVIAADTVVVVDADILGKPDSTAHAVETLQRLVGRTHEVYTGVAVLRTADNHIGTNYAVTKVTMANKDIDWLRWYVQTGEPMDKAGAYAIQGIGSLLVDSIQGDFYNVVGLPVATLNQLLEETCDMPLRHWMQTKTP